MLLKFLGRGSAFSDEHNCAFFSEGRELVLIDHSLTAFNRLKNAGVHALTGTESADRIYVIITHTHSDHICGIPLLIEYAYYIRKLPVTVAAASERVAENMRYYLDEIEGCEKGTYELVPAESLKWVSAVIPTEHTPTLSGKCFGYALDIGGRKVVYTGDTVTLEPFLPYIGADTELYTEIAAVRSGVHLYLDDNIQKLKELSAAGTKIALMHLDDERKISEAIEGTGITLAELWNG